LTSFDQIKEDLEIDVAVSIKKITSIMNELRTLIDQREMELKAQIEKEKEEQERILSEEKEDLESLLESISFCVGYTNLLLEKGTLSEVACSGKMITSRISQLLSISSPLVVAHQQIKSRKEKGSLVRYKEEKGVDKKQAISSILSSYGQIESTNILGPDVSAENSFLDLDENWKGVAAIHETTKICVVPVDPSNKVLPSGINSDYFDIAFHPPENIEVAPLPPSLLLPSPSSL